MSNPNGPLDHDLFMLCARDTVKLLRNHASLALWVGGNEQVPPKDINAALKNDLKLHPFFMSVVGSTALQEDLPQVSDDPSKYLDGTRAYISDANTLQILDVSDPQAPQFLGAYDDARPGLAEIGFVTTAPQQQGKGVATALMKRLLQLPYDEFVLRDIKDTNAPALGLYRKLGFSESNRRPVRFASHAGFSAYVSMTLKTATR